MDVRRQARLTQTALAPSSMGNPLQGLQPQPPIGPGPLSVPVPGLAPGYPHTHPHAHGHPHSHVASRVPGYPAQVPGSHLGAHHGGPYSLQVAARAQGETDRQGGERGLGAGGGGKGGYTGGVSESTIRKDRRKDRHKRASDGRNPMIRLNPSTADRFFAVQRLLESRRLKKTSGSYVINWLIDVADASIQAVLAQGQGGPEAGHKGQIQAQAQAQAQTQAQARAQAQAQGQAQGMGAPPSQSGQEQQNQHQQHVQDGQQPAAHEPEQGEQQEHADVDSDSADVLRDDKGAVVRSGAFPGLSALPGISGLAQSQPTQGQLGRFPGSGEDFAHLGALSVHHTMSLFDASTIPGILGAGEGMPLQVSDAVRFNAAEIARTAMASADAAEKDQDVDDQDEEVDIVTDGDVGFDASTALQHFGTTHPDPLWMRARQFPSLGAQPLHEDEEEEDGTEQ